MGVLFSRFIYQLRAIFPPGISGFIISIVGIELGLEGLEQFLELSSHSYHASLEKHIIIGLFTLGAMVGLSIWWKGLIKFVCSFVGLVGLFCSLLIRSGCTAYSSINYLYNGFIGCHYCVIFTFSFPTRNS